ncbi:protein YpmT [Malaciobacter molluscorum]|uniref:protein YpmT n=1 Tax=Malaciobacter molluscorum TaxID=1032072 RepID=UPI0034D327A5
MCLVIALIFLALAYTFYGDSNMLGVYINIAIAFLFIILMIRNIIKTRAKRT